MPITNRNFYNKETTRFRNHRTLVWIKDMEYENNGFTQERTTGEGGRVQYMSFISTEEMKSLSSKTEDEEMHNKNDKFV